MKDLISTNRFGDFAHRRVGVWSELKLVVFSYIFGLVYTGMHLIGGGDFNPLNPLNMSMIVIVFLKFYSAVVKLSAGHQHRPIHEHCGYFSRAYM